MARTPNSALDKLGSVMRETPDVIAHFLASIVESSDDAILSKTLDGVITSWNRAAESLFGYTSEEAIGQSVSMLIPEDRLHEETVILTRVARGERTDHYETVRRRKDGSLIEVSLTVSPIRTAEGLIVGASKIARDITEQRLARERQLFLIRELQHRTLNLFAVIQSVAQRSLVEPLSLPQAKTVFFGRLEALAQAHSILAESAWEGGSLTNIVERVLASFSDQLKVKGRDIVVNTQAAQQFALTLHELTTNALKYGALSAPTGRVSISWEVIRTEKDGLLSFLWKETGGPPVSQPQRRGFGSIILLEGAKQFGKQVTLNYDPDGVRYEAQFSLSAIEAQPLG